MPDARTLSTPAPSPELHAALLAARAALGLALLARLHVQRCGAANRAGKSSGIDFRGTDAELAAAISLASRDLRQAAEEARRGDGRMAERLACSATARVIAGVDVARPLWRSYSRAPLPHGASTPSDDLSTLAEIAAELGAAQETEDAPPARELEDAQPAGRARQRRAPSRLAA